MTIGAVPFEVYDQHLIHSVMKASADDINNHHIRAIKMSCVQYEHSKIKQQRNHSYDYRTISKFNR